MGSTGAVKSTGFSAVTQQLEQFVANRDISERSRMYGDELATILGSLPVGARIYTGSTTATLGVMVDGERLFGSQPTFYEKVSDNGEFSQYRLFGSTDYSETYSDTILKELARGKRLGKLNISIRNK